MTTKTDTPVTGDLTLNDIAAAVPRALEVFASHGLDSCCGGAKPLALVCEKHHLDLDAVLQEIRALA